MRTLTLLSPRAEAWRSVATATSKRTSLTGSRAAILNNGWTSMDVLADTIGASLVEHYGVSAVQTWDVPYGEPAADEVFQAVIADADVAVVGLAN